MYLQTQYYTHFTNQQIHLIKYNKIQFMTSVIYDLYFILVLH